MAPKPRQSAATLWLRTFKELVSLAVNNPHLTSKLEDTSAAGLQALQAQAVAVLQILPGLANEMRRVSSWTTPTMAAMEQQLGSAHL